ncbi:MAG: DUF2066 domain-containing protein [Gammaproteobacteria bacterium]|nr:DUF2066 domain-containing protein [Gammaproteobacteria bacterium]
MTVSVRSCLSQIFAFFLLVSVSGGNVFAGDVEGLYEVDRLVVGQEADERNAALSDALAILIERVGGKKGIVEPSGLTPTLKQAKDYVERFEYIPLDNVPAEPGTTQPQTDRAGREVGSDNPEPAAPVFRYRLHILFDKSSIERLLEAHQVPIWGRLRPTLIVWLAVDDGVRRFTVAPDNAEGLDKTLADVGIRRGLPIILPLMDLEEQARIGFSDIWGDFADNIRAASSRYRAGAELVGRAYRQDGVWSLRWSLYSEAQADHWEGRDVSLDAGLAQALDQAADRLGDLYARSADQVEDKHVEMEVSDVNDISGYARLLAYLQSLELIGDVVVAKVQADRVTFDLHLKRESRMLRKAIEFDDTLGPATTEDAGVLMSDGSKDILRYRLLQ